MPITPGMAGMADQLEDRIYKAAHEAMQTNRSELPHFFQPQTIRAIAVKAAEAARAEFIKRIKEVD